MKILLAANWGELAERIKKAVLNYERRERKLAANQTCPTRKSHSLLPGTSSSITFTLSRKKK